MNPFWQCVSSCSVHLPAAAIAGYIALHGSPACNEVCPAIVIPRAQFTQPGGYFTRGGPGFALLHPHADVAPRLAPAGELAPGLWGGPGIETPGGSPVSFVAAPEPVPVPEPASWVVLAVGVVAVVAIRSRRTAP